MASRPTRLPLLLLIEDHRDTLVAAGRLLEASGFVVDIAKGGEQGIDKAKQLRPDVVVTDVMMPGTNGCEVCEELYADAATRQIPIIVYTGVTDARAVASVVRIGVRVIAIKPCLPTVLAREARTLLTAHGAAAKVRVVTGDGEELPEFAQEVEAHALEAAN
jgi:DNA-binding response OmpR family regulator